MHTIGAGIGRERRERREGEGLPFDPDNWDHMRALGHRMVDDMLWHLRTVRDRPVWQPVPEDVRARLAEPLPRTGAGERGAYDAFMRDVLPYGIGNIHPRFWGW